MAKDPAFLFYPGDWQGGTSTFSRHLKGCYMDVLIAQFNAGPLSLEEIKTVLGSDFGQAWPTIRKKFKTTEDGLFFNERLEAEKEKRAKFTNSRRENIKKRYQKTTSEGTSVEDMKILMENENENRDDSSLLEGGMGETKTPGESEMGMLLSEIDIGGIVEYVRITTQNLLSQPQVCEFWEAFKIQHFTGTKFYPDEHAIKQHFRDWIKKQNQTQHATGKITPQPKSGFGKSAGAIRLAHQLAKNRGFTGSGGT